MRTFVSKYATAAHLAILAVAPLFLLPFFTADTLATVLLWLSLLTGIWVLIEPSRRRGELLHDARARVAVSIVKDTLFWILVGVVLFATVRWLNSGIGLAYDAELGSWSLRQPSVPVLPGSEASVGYLGFATPVALTVLMMGCRHALGKMARIAFLAIATCLAMLAAVMTIVLVHWDFSCVTVPSSVYGLYFVGGLVALLGAFAVRWRKIILILAFAATGAWTGLYFFAATPIVLLYLIVGLVMMMVCCSYAAFCVGSLVPFKFLSLLLIAVAFPVLMAMGFSTGEFTATRFAFFAGEAPLFAPDFLQLREILSRIAFAAWSEHPWLGTGLGSFPFDVRFQATAADWAVLISAPKETLNGWWQLLVERGILGALSYALVIGTLLVSLVWRAVKAWGREFFIPACVLGPLVLLALIAETFVTVSFLRVEVLLAAGSFLALAVSSFPTGDK